MNDRIVLRPGREKALKQHHPWVFSGAVAKGGEGRSGEFLPVYSSQGEFLGTGYFHSRSSIIGRMVCFDARPPLQAVEDHLREAIGLRKMLFPSQEVTGYRLVNGEGDQLPGLIVDRYGEGLVLQISTLGMERLRDQLVELLKQELKPAGIYERSITPARLEEKLSPREGWLVGGPRDFVDIQEYGLRYRVWFADSQKTGFFLDQREMRQLVRRYAANRRVLNCFSYTGAFSVSALAGGASHVTSVDASETALAGAEVNAQLNGFSEKQHRTQRADLFQFLRKEPLDYSLIVLDPPAFAKRRKDVIAACRGYKDINRLAIQKAPPGTLLLTSSCSHFVDDLLFQQVVFQASTEAGRRVQLLDRHHYAPDHPVDLCHPEAHYLKSLLLYIR